MNSVSGAAFFCSHLEGREWLLSEDAEEISCQCRKGMNFAAKITKGSSTFLKQSSEVPAGSRLGCGLT